MKPQSAQRKTLGSQKEFFLEHITEQIISCAIEVPKTKTSKRYPPHPIPSG